MCAGLVQYTLRQGVLGDVGLVPGAKAQAARKAEDRAPLTAEERGRMWVVAILVLFIMTFFFVFEQPHL